jgi:DNA-binding CsgD family transcriptional regulator
MPNVILQVPANYHEYLGNLPISIVIAALDGSILWRNEWSLGSVLVEKLSLRQNRFASLDDRIDTQISAIFRQVSARPEYAVDVEIGGVRVLAVPTRTLNMDNGADPTSAEKVISIFIYVDLLSNENNLTNVEKKIALSLAAGRNMRQTSAELGISYHTGRKYLQTIFSKTGVKRQAELVARMRAGG